MVVTVLDLDTPPSGRVSCAFCSNAQAGPLQEPWDRPLYETENFVVLPSLGALVEGWLLIIPRDHYISLGALPAELVAEFEVVKIRTARLTASVYGHVAAFEHGPACASRPTGCGVDHAHLHVVPVSIDLGAAVARYLPIGAEWRAADLHTCQQAYRQQQDYLYLEQPVGSGRAVAHAGLGSQLFRRAIADSLGVPLEYNWREYHQHERVAATIAAYGTVKDIHRAACR